MIKKAAFTLIEVMIALAIIAIALGAVSVTIHRAVGLEEGLRLRLSAHWVATNILSRGVNQIQHGQSLNPITGTVRLLDSLWCWSLASNDLEEKPLMRLTVTLTQRPAGPVYLEQDTVAIPLASLKKQNDDKATAW